MNFLALTKQLIIRSYIASALSLTSDDYFEYLRGQD